MKFKFCLLISFGIFAKAMDLSSINNIELPTFQLEQIDTQCLDILADAAHFNKTQEMKQRKQERAKKYEPNRLSSYDACQVSLVLNKQVFYVCMVNECHKSFRCPSQLEEHMVSHTKQKRFACSLCDCVFPYKTSLKHHMMGIHLKYKPFSCTYFQCTYRAVSQSLIRSHIKKKHTVA